MSNFTAPIRRGTAVLRSTLVILGLALLSGCKILITVPPGGTVVSESTFCPSDGICEVDVSSTQFKETFSVETEPGFEFVGWRSAFRHLCGGNNNDCAIETAGFAGNAALMAFLNNDEIFYLAPIIVPSAPTVSGNITYDRVPQRSLGQGLDYNNITAMPVRGATVQLIDSATDQVLQETLSDAAGAYAFTANSTDAVFVRVRAQSQRVGTPNWDITIRDNTQGDALYVMDGEDATPADMPQRNLHAPSGWGGSSYTTERTAGPFALLDTMYDATLQLVEIDLDINLPPLQVFWSEKNSTASGNLADGDIGTSFHVIDNGQPKLYILGQQDDDTDEYDVHVVVHEWMHYMDNQIARSDSFGGRWGGGEILDIRLAFGEGLANGLGAALLDNPWYADSHGPGQQGVWSFSMEAGARFNPGWFSSSSVQSLIYDLYDEQHDGADDLTLGLRPIYAALTGEHRVTPAMTSIFSFVDSLLNHHPELAGSLANMLEAESITGDIVDPYGSREQNRPPGDRDGVQSMLPVYPELDVNGNAIEVCSQTHFDFNGDGNKLGVDALVRFSVPGFDQYQVLIERTSGMFGSDPDFTVYRQGLPVLGGFNPDADFESATGPLNAGPHILNLYGYYNAIQPGDANAGDVCYAVSIQAQ
ncbi:hypothetical protein BST95_08890 [Halioglobus japonicus]|uniref:Bacterial repeat domain-containing protein n=1 Tax=Halioglobus japonicus TaxID=930805 RepID=A0AAP8MF27_9GAMM|nr:hypothetical protein BST95_08890 [Halioglobus japonicus]PLW86347.1 hypothetical protein C0029_07930 [Halioglobus japonicus]